MSEKTIVSPAGLISFPNAQPFVKALWGPGDKLEAEPSNSGVINYLGPANRTATQTGPPMENPGWRSIAAFLNVTTNPGGAETLRLDMLAWTPTIGFTPAWVAATANTFGGGPGTQVVTAGPGCSTAVAVGSGSATLSNMIPRFFGFKVNHSSTGIWVYTIDLMFGR